MSTEQAPRQARAGRPARRPAWRSARPSAWRLARPPVRDAAIAAIAAIVGVAAAYGEAHPSTPGTYFVPPHHLPDTPPAALLLVAAAGAVLAWRHRYPRAVTVASTALVIAYTLPGYENGAALLLPAVALGTLATSVPVRWSAAWTVALTAALMAATAVSNPLGEFGGGFFLIPATNAVALFAGIAVASRRAYTESVRVQAARRAEEEAQRRVDEERLRIARELHDVVAHTMATITVQAAAAAQLLRDRPDEAAESLRAIRSASKDGLRELRATLDLLRSSSPSSEEADPAALAGPASPAPGLDRLDALTARVRAAGLPVTVTITGHPRDLPALTGLAAFRIIQEALTNTLRHAGPATAAVTVHYAAAALCIEVTDTGRGAAGPAGTAGPAGAGPEAGNPAGYGLRGMRERAAVAGGTVQAGPLPHGGFLVTAVLPLDDPPPVPPTPGTARPADAGQQASAGQEPATGRPEPGAGQESGTAEAARKAGR